jgi:hypothetical protein
MDRLGLRLITGPANAGKLRRLLDGYVEALSREPVLIVPTRPDVELVERELVARCGALMGGSVGTFDDLFRRIAAGADDPRPAATDAQAALVLGRAVAATSLNGLAASARSRGFVDGCWSPPRSTATLRGCTPPTAPSSTGCGSPTASSYVRRRPSASAPSSTRGAASPSSPTASKT